MAEVINMPRLSDTMEEGTLAKWFKKVGDSVNEGDILAEIETDKATMEFESFHEGELLHIGIKEGETAPVDSIIAIIGKKGEDVERLRQEVARMMGVPVHINIEEVRKPDLDARLVGDNVAGQLERRVMFRRAMKRAVQNAMKSGAEGIRIQLSGRLGGAEIARTEWYREGRVPLHTLRADIDYASVRAETTYGTIGVKVWIFRGEVLGGMEQVQEEQKQSKGAKKRGRG